MIDLSNTECFNCNSGLYIETSVMDDINGVLHCSNCNQQIERYIPDNTPDNIYSAD